MPEQLLLLIAETLVIYGLILWAHAVRHKVGLTHFYVLIGALAALTFWLNDAGVAVDVDGMTFTIGSTVFHTALLLAVFVIYVFEGPRSTRITIATIITIALVVPAVAAILQWQMNEQAAMSYIPLPSLRLHAAFIFSLLADLVFLAVAWEFWARPKIAIHLWVRVFLTLLLLVSLDAVLFTTGAFFNELSYWSQLKGTLLSRVLTCIAVSPCLYSYLYWQRHNKALSVDMLPVLAIHQEMTDMRRELTRVEQEVEHHKQVGRQLESQVYTDELTQIANRRFFDFTFEHEWKRALRSHQPLAVIMCDIDHFKLYNDHYGHLQGDDCLRRVAQKIRDTLYRPADMVARYGGEEFIILLPETAMLDALDVADRICRAVQSLAIEHNKSVTYPFVTLSLGVASCQPNITPQSIALIEQADKALYNAKEAGRNRVSPHLKKITKAFMRIV